MADYIEELKNNSGKIIVVCRIGVIVAMIIGAVISAGCLGSSGSSGSSGSAHYQVKVTTPGAWAGILSTEGSTKSISGTGSETIEVNNPRGSLTATVWKKDNSTENMLMEIIKDGNVIKSDESNFKYGSMTLFTLV
jgi:hypothetical protein